MRKMKPLFPLLRTMVILISVTAPARKIRNPNPANPYIRYSVPLNSLYPLLRTMKSLNPLLRTVVRLVKGAHCSRLNRVISACRSRARLAGRGAQGGARARAPPQSALDLSERKSRLRELPERQRHTVRYRRGIYSVSLPVKRGLGPPGTRKLATKEREDHGLLSHDRCSRTSVRSS